MRKFKYILLLVVASAVWGCQKFNDEDTTASTESLTISSSIVEVLEDGRYQVTATLEGVSMTSVTTRASATEDIIRDGWCLVFGEDEDNFNHSSTEINEAGLLPNTGTGEYSDNSPLIQIERVTINANGTFVMVFDEYPHTAFMRIVANMTDREDTNLEDGITSWRMACTSNGLLDETMFQTPPTFDQVSTKGIATFGQYRHQSVGLDGLYQMKYSTKSNIVKYSTGGFQDTNGNYGFKDIVDYTNSYGNPTIMSVVQWSVQYSTEDGSNGVSSVTGLDETYNTTQPNPAAPLTTGFPMSSYGIVMNDGITEESLKEAFGSTVYMIRACSKVAVNVVDEGFEMEAVYLIDAAQEARIRSTVISGAVTDEDDNTTVASTTLFSIPVDLGGTITYQGLTTSGTTSEPIYFYPNSGGGYIYNDSSVDQDINPQYIIIKGQAAGYDTPGYYKVALKAQYPLSDLSTEDNMDNTDYWSTLTYDILRNTSFTVNLNLIDKPGYKTLSDAANPEAPANNISYSIDIETSENQYEVLVSKGTYYAELETSRVYVKGYMDEGIDGCYVDFTLTTSAGNTTPAIYVQSSDYDGDDYDDENIIIERAEVWTQYSTDGTWAEWTDSSDDATDYGLETNTTDDGLSGQLINIPRSEGQEDSATETKRKVRVYFSAEGSGRVRLRIGDILKFIPVLYDPIPVSMYGTAGQDGTGTGVVVSDDAISRSWSDFSYSEIVQQSIGSYGDKYSVVDGLVDSEDNAFGLLSDGTIAYSNEGQYDIKPELRARIYPSDAGDGIAVLYLRQASDFVLTNDDEVYDEDDTYSVEFTAQGQVWKNNTNGIFSGDRGDRTIVFSTASDGVGYQSVDALTIGIETVATSATVDGTQFFVSTLSDNDQTLTLDIQEMDYSNQAYTSKPTNMITYNYTAESTITLTNVAGDYKTYTINQTQYPPIYLVSPYGTDEKTYAVWDNWYNNRGLTKGGCVVYVVNMYNYDDGSDGDDDNDSYGVVITTTPYYSGTSGKEAYSGYAATAMLTNLYQGLFDQNYIENYNYTSDIGLSTLTVVGTNANGGTRSFYGTGDYQISEFNKQSGDSEADAAIVAIRNYQEVYDSFSSNIDYGTSYYTAYAYFNITVTDKYNETYTTSKTFRGL